MNSETDEDGCGAGKNEKFVAAALEFPQVVILTGEVMRLTPGFLRRLVPDRDADNTLS